MHDARSLSQDPVGGRLGKFYKEWETTIRDRWVLQIISVGYKLEFKRRHLKSLFLQSRIPGEPRARQALSKILMDLWKQEVIRPVPKSQRGLGVYSPLFLIKKKTGEYRAILDLRVLNRSLRVRRFKMESLRSVLQEIDQGDWLISIDIKDAYLHIPVASSHPKFLRFVVLGKHFQYQAIPFGLDTSPRTFTKVLITLIAVLRERGIQVYAYLDDILIKSREHQLLIHQRNYVLNFLQRHGWKVNFSKSHLTPVQHLQYLGVLIDSIQMSFSDKEEGTRCQKISTGTQTERSLFGEGVPQCNRQVHSSSRGRGMGEFSSSPITMGFSEAVVQRSIQHEAEDFSEVEDQGEFEVVVPLSQSSEGEAHPITTMADSYYRCQQSRLGRSYQQSAAPGLVVRGDEAMVFESEGITSSLGSSSRLSTENKRVVGECSFRQYHSGELSEETRGNQIKVPDEVNRENFSMGRGEFVPLDSNIHPRTNEYRSRLPQQIQDPSGGVVAGFPHILEKRDGGQWK
ncbi:uncharacterized protein LOC121397903 isoform X2 [Xenopus laevis]|uniref:ribonuclease H n=1 Tax=Xenopus laevis TaxID=8355 RepID=A0A8J1LR62_XENLA|nr:uncharacterized protein LOC121397903 isoform X2 [Xenopus laevis]